MMMSASLPSSALLAKSVEQSISDAALTRSLQGNSRSTSSSISTFLNEKAFNKLEEKPVLAPPVFVFHRLTSLKRRVEDGGHGPVINKRVRSFTYPYLNGRSRRGVDRDRRTLSSSFSFPPPLPVSRSNVFMPSSLCNANKVTSDMATDRPPCVRVKRTVLRPAVLVAPQPWKDLPHLQVSLNAADELDTVSIEHQTAKSAFAQLSSSPSNSNHVKLETSNKSSIQFVFGENMGERVLHPLKDPYSEEVSDTDSSSSDSDSSSPETSHNSTVKHSLWESAAATTASCRRHCLLKQVPVITGEERESNVVQLSCKLFVLENSTQSWSERGRGTLRLNDLATGNRGELQSRIVMRHQGSLKVILNTRLWPHTQLRRPARRNLQVTATDLENHAIRVFLIQAGARDISRLHAAIHHRLVGMHCRAGLRGCGGCSEDDEDDDDINGRRDCRKDAQDTWNS